MDSDGGWAWLACIAKHVWELLLAFLLVLVLLLALVPPDDSSWNMVDIFNGTPLEKIWFFLCQWVSIADSFLVRSRTPVSTHPSQCWDPVWLSLVLALCDCHSLLSLYMHQTVVSRKGILLNLSSAVTKGRVSHIQLIPWNDMLLTNWFLWWLSS